MLCKQETNDPRKCIEEGKNVTACALEVFRGIKKHCQSDFNRYVHCLEHSSGSMELDKYVFDIKNHIYFCEVSEN